LYDIFISINLKQTLISPLDDTIANSHIKVVHISYDILPIRKFESHSQVKFNGKQ